jgi:hypothetical protein
MLLRNSSGLALAVAAIGFAVTAAPARADLPISLQLGAQFAQQSNARNAGGDTQTSFGLNYDFIRAPIVPVQVSFQFDDSNGTHDSGTLNELGFGVAARLTTPLYAGIGFSVYNVDARLAFPNAPSLTSTGIGTNIFAGYRFLSLPGGVNFALQGTYKQLPTLNGINPSSFGAGVRVQL